MFNRASERSPKLPIPATQILANARSVEHASLVHLCKGYHSNNSYLKSVQVHIVCGLNAALISIDHETIQMSTTKVQRRRQLTL